MNRLRGQNRYETARIRVLHIPDADEIPMQVYEVNGFSEVIRSIIIPGEETVREFRLNSADATYGHRLYWGDALGARVWGEFARFRLGQSVWGHQGRPASYGRLDACWKCV